MLAFLRRDRSLGARGERDARAYLRRRRYRILERNLRTDHGELDIIALAPDRCTVVVVEVKARRVGAADAPPPEASVTAQKRAKLLELTERLLNRRAWNDRPVRIDVIAVSYGERAKPSVRHFKNAVTRDSSPSSPRSFRGR